VAPIVSVFDDLKDYLSDSDLSLDYKLARQRRKHTRKANAVAAAKSLNRQAQLASLMQANRKAAAEGSGRGSATAKNDGDKGHERIITHSESEIMVGGTGEKHGISEEALLPAVPQRKTCAVTGHQRGRSLEPISEEAHQLAADDQGRSESFESKDLATTDRPLTMPGLAEDSKSIGCKNNSILANNKSISASGDRKRPESNIWHVEDPYEEQPAQNPSDSSCELRTADQRLTAESAGSLSSCALVSAAQTLLQGKGQQDRTANLSDLRKSDQNSVPSSSNNEGKQQ
jgi:hypothetical protein